MENVFLKRLYFERNGGSSKSSELEILHGNKNKKIHTFPEFVYVNLKSLSKYVTALTRAE